MALLILGTRCGAQDRSGGLVKIHGCGMSGRVTALDSGEGHGRSGLERGWRGGVSFHAVGLDPNFVQGLISMDGYYE